MSAWVPGRCSHGIAQRRSYLAEGIEYVVKVHQDLPLCDLCNVVHGLAGIVPDPGILIGEACEDRRHYDVQVSGELLQRMALG